MNIGHYLAVITTIILLTLPTLNAFAYIGPGAGISAIGTVTAVIAAIILAIVGFVWFPMKRLIAKFKQKEKETDAE